MVLEKRDPKSGRVTSTGRAVVCVGLRHWIASAVYWSYMHFGGSLCIPPPFGTAVTMFFSAEILLSSGDVKYCDFSDDPVSYALPIVDPSYSSICKKYDKGVGGGGVQRCMGWGVTELPIEFDIDGENLPDFCSNLGSRPFCFCTRPLMADGVGGHRTYQVSAVFVQMSKSHVYFPSCGLLLCFVSVFLTDVINLQ